ncbi:MAG TPA: hypothetical protein GYA06_04365 [Chloroflexi bacterium]|nr:hypothetical protein [Chloroflexota bacterium]
MIQLVTIAALSVLQTEPPAAPSGPVTEVSPIIAVTVLALGLLFALLALIPVWLSAGEPQERA